MQYARRMTGFLYIFISVFSLICLVGCKCWCLRDDSHSAPYDARGSSTGNWHNGDSRGENN